MASRYQFKIKHEPLALEGLLLSDKPRDPKYELKNHLEIIPKDFIYNYIREISDKKINLNTINIDNLLKQNFSKLINNSNIQLNPLSRAPSLVAADIFRLDSATGEISGGRASEIYPAGFLDFIQRFSADSYFPFILDINDPDKFIFGIGENSRLQDGTVAERTLIRNGGHVQLLQAYRSDQNSSGIYGGGIRIGEDGQIIIEFKSRSMNNQKGAVDGQLEEAESKFLSELVMNILINAEEAARARSRVIRPEALVEAFA